MAYPVRVRFANSASVVNAVTKVYFFNFYKTSPPVIKIIYLTVLNLIYRSSTKLASPKPISLKSYLASLPPNRIPMDLVANRYRKRYFLKLRYALNRPALALQSRDTVYVMSGLIPVKSQLKDLVSLIYPLGLRGFYSLGRTSFGVHSIIAGFKS
jgi:hypothetical protein